LREEDMYDPILTCFLKKFRSAGYSEVHLEITSNGRFSERLRKALGTRVGFLKRHFAPDICGFTEVRNRLQPISIEVKSKRLGFQEIFQAKGYGELIEARFAFLISNQSIISTVRDFLRNKESILIFGYPDPRIMHIGRFDHTLEQLVEEDWFPKSPF
jgi:hypothetical protein